jgi:hypothetical protein
MYKYPSLVAGKVRDSFSQPLAAALVMGFKPTTGFW